MDTERFDRLTRSFSGAASRRDAVRALVGATLGALGPAVLTGEEGGAARRCRDGKERCGGKCRAKCRPGKQRDPRSCECECVRKRCRGGKEFNLKRCRCECPGDMKDCGDGVCIGLDRCCPDDEACPEDPQGCCNNSALKYCTIDGCCDLAIEGNQICNDFCVDTTSENNHCGGCGVKCGPCERCENGTCRGACDPGLTCCGGQCILLNEGEECCGGASCPSGKCHEGKYCCAGTFSKFCPGDPGTCCRPEYHCKTGPNGNAICSSNP